MKEFITTSDSIERKLFEDHKYHPYGTIELRVPIFSEGKFDGSYRIIDISYPMAIKVLESHKRQLKKKLEELQQ